MNAILENFGISPPWLSDPNWARASTVLVDVWQWTPFVFIIALAGLQGLPTDILEASRVDGATSWQVLRTMIVPLMAPILWLIVLLPSTSPSRSPSAALAGPLSTTAFSTTARRASSSITAKRQLRPSCCLPWS
jgi:ABC-type methionine transport system permease subunit